MEQDKKLYEQVIEEIEHVKKFHEEEIEHALKLRHWVHKNILDCVQQNKESFYQDTIKLMGTKLLMKLTNDKRVDNQFHEQLQNYVFVYFGKEFEDRKQYEDMKIFLDDVFKVSMKCEDDCKDKEQL